jgi:hypothetical protein
MLGVKGILNQHETIFGGDFIEINDPIHTLTFRAVTTNRV